MGIPEQREGEEPRLNASTYDALDYVRRIATLADGIGDTTTLHAVLVGEDGMPRTLTSQQHVDGRTLGETYGYGSAAAAQLLTKVMADAGFVPFFRMGAWLSLDDGLILGDVHEGNVILTPDNGLVIIDASVSRLTRPQARKLVLGMPNGQILWAHRFGIVDALKGDPNETWPLSQTSLSLAEQEINSSPATAVARVTPEALLEVLDFLDKKTGGKLQLKLVGEIIVDPNNPDIQESLAEYEAAGIDTRGRGRARGYRQDLGGGRSLIALALAQSDDQLWIGARGEAFHHLFQNSLSEEERQFLIKTFKSEEGAESVWSSRRAGQVKTTGRVEAIFAKLSQILAMIGNTLRGRGFHSVEDIFGRLERADLREAPPAEAAAPKPGRLQPVQLAVAVANPHLSPKDKTLLEKGYGAVARRLPKLTGYLGALSDAVGSFSAGTQEMVRLTARREANAEIRAGRAQSDLLAALDGIKGHARRKAIEEYFGAGRMGIDTKRERDDVTRRLGQRHITADQRKFYQEWLRILKEIDAAFGGNPAQVLWEKKTYNPGDTFELKFNKYGRVRRNGRFVGYRTTTPAEELASAEAQFKRLQSLSARVLNKTAPQGKQPPGVAKLNAAMLKFSTRFGLPLSRLQAEFLDQHGNVTTGQDFARATQGHAFHGREVVDYEYESQSEGKWIASTADKRYFEETMAQGALRLKTGHEAAPAIQAWENNDDGMFGTKPHPLSADLGTSQGAMGNAAAPPIGRHWAVTMTDRAIASASAESNHWLAAGAIDHLTDVLEEGGMARDEAVKVATMTLHRSRESLLRHGFYSSRMGSFEMEQGPLLVTLTPLLNLSTGITSDYFKSGQKRIDDFRNWATVAPDGRVVVSPERGIEDHIDSSLPLGKFNKHHRQMATLFMQAMGGLESQSIPEGHISSAISWLSKFQFLTKVAVVPYALAQNSMQAAALSGRYGLRRAALGYAHAFVDLAREAPLTATRRLRHYVPIKETQGLRKAVRAGVVAGETVMDQELNDRVPPGSQAAVHAYRVAKLLSLGFLLTERMPRIASAHATMLAANDVLNSLKKGGFSILKAVASVGSDTEAENRRFLTTLGLTSEEVDQAIRRGSFTEYQEDLIMNFGAAENNLRPKATHQMGAAVGNSSSARLIRTFTQFPFGVSRLLAQQASDAVSRGNFLPIINSMAGIMATGTILAYYTMLRDDDEEKRKDWVEEDKRLWQEVLYRIHASGGFGYFEDPSRMFDPIGMIPNAEFAARAAMTGYAMESRLINRKDDEQAAAIAHELNRWLSNEVRMYRTVRRNAQTDFQKEVRKAQDVTRFFLEEREGKGALGRVAARASRRFSKGSDFRNEASAIWDAVTAGKAEAAAKSRDKYIESVWKSSMNAPDEDGFDKMERAYETGLGHLLGKGYAPLGDISEEMEEEFYSWVVERKGREAADKFFALQDQYVENIETLFDLADLTPPETTQ